MKDFIFLIIFPCLFLSCKQKDYDDIYDLFSQKKELCYQKILLDYDFFGRPSKLMQKDSIIFIIDMGKESFFSLVDVKNGKHLGECGKKGQGPNEFLSPFRLHYVNDTLIGIYDLFKHSLIGVDIEKLKKGVEHYSMIVKGSSICFSVTPTAYDNFIGFGPFEEGLIKIFDKNGSEIGSYYEFPYSNEAEKNIPNRLRAMAYQGMLISNPSLNKFAYGAAYAPIFYIFEASEDHVSLVKKWALSYPDYKPEEKGQSIAAIISANNKNGFCDVYATEKYVYVAYSGRSMKEYQERAFEANDVFVFDWEGTPIMRYVLNVSIQSFCVSPNDDKLYAFSNIPDPVLIGFDL